MKETEYFVDTPRRETIASRDMWQNLSMDELLSTRSALETRLYQYRNSSMGHALKNAISELNSLIASKNKSNNEESLNYYF